MTITTIETQTASEAFEKLEELARSGAASLFRGHRDASWRLQSTFARHRPVPFSRFSSTEIDEMIDHFIVRLRSMNIDVPFEIWDRRGRLEFARHYGVPSPLIDFSLSPYVALFFAFNGVKPLSSTGSDYAAIYCLNIQEVASVWARNCARKHNGDVDSSKMYAEHRKFLSENENLFSNGYDVGVLKYFSMPASWNRRMTRQLGVFLYDTLPHAERDGSGLEVYLSQEEVLSYHPHGKVMLTKVVIPHSAGKEVFEQLEITGTSATQLYDSHEGAVMDVINAYNYGRRTGYAWDVRLLPPVTDNDAT
jgi:hypothetical protein